VSRPPARHQKPRSKAARAEPSAGPDRQDRAAQQDRQDRSASSGWFPAPTASATLTASGALALSAAPAVLTRPARPARPAGPASHRKPSAPRKRSSALRDKRIVAAVAGSTLLVSAAAASPTVIRWSEAALHPAAANQAPALNDLRANSQAGQDATGGLINTAGNASNQWAQIPTAQVTAARLAAVQRAAARRAAAARAAAEQRQAEQAQAAATAAAYANPLRNVSGLVPERVDQGVDFSGSGPVYAIGDGVVTEAEGSGSGWPGGGWITYRLTSGPAQGLVVYVAEDVTPEVQVGQTVTSSTVLANMFNGSDGIETGWAEGDGSSEEPESQAPEAGGIGADGPFPTIVGLNFDELLQALGVPAAPNAGEAGSGALPQGYPANWSAAVKP
jgi:murein DD-endopeptidase MepM/ murein hydrolase activator NlpD